MEYRRLGRTGMQVSLLGMGTGGHNCLGQTTDPPRPREEMVRFLRQAFDLGVNLFDTAPAYLDSEEILGQALEGLPRDEVVVSTKVGLTAYGPDREVVVATPEAIVDSVEASLRRLQLEALDLVLVAVLAPRYRDVVLNEHMPVLYKLRDQGKIRHIGSSEVSSDDGAHEWLQVALQADCFDAVMVAHNMLNQSARRTVLPTCVERDVGAMNIFTVRNVFRDPRRLAEVVTDLQDRGILPADLDAGDPFGWLPDVDSLVEAAYRYAAYAPGVSTVMCGTVTLEKVAADIGYLAQGPLADESIARLERAFGHIAEAIGN